MPQSLEVKVPHLGDFANVPVVEIFVSPGDVVNKEDSLIAIESEKAVMEIPSPVAGTIDSLKVKIRDEVSEGDLVLTLMPAETQAPEESKQSGVAPPDEISAEKIPPPKGAPSETGDLSREQKSPAIPESSGTAQAIAAPAIPEGNAFERDPRQIAHASPSVRRLARTLGADLSQITGSGPKGRITKEDVTTWIKGRLAGQAPSGADASAEDFIIDPAEFQKHGEIEIRELSKIRRVSGQRLAKSARVIPHVTQFESADITALEEFRKSYLKKNPEVKITLLAFFVKATALALVEFPEFNASLDATGGRLLIKKYRNIGVAIDTPEGLVVPSIKNADTKNITQLAAEIETLSQKAQERKLTFDDLSGGSFTVSSLGAIGGTGFIPIINPPEVAICGVSRASTQAILDPETGHFRPRLILPFSLSYDHRVIDGVLGGRFCRYLSRELSDAREMLM